MNKMTPYQSDLVANNKGLAEHLANVAWNQNKHELDRDEVVSIAYLGLCAAALMYNPRAHGMSEETIENGKAFAGYARIKINGAILDWQKSNDYVPRRSRQLYRDLVALGYGSTDISFEELAEAKGESVEKIKSVLLAVASTTGSLDTDVLPEGELTSPQNVESEAVVTEILTATSEAFSRLPLKHQEVLARKYLKQESFDVIGTAMNIKHTKVRSLHRMAVMELMRVMQDKSTTLGAM
jgi:RNA polymerase sigma factor (sigma-70 family)